MITLKFLYIYTFLFIFISDNLIIWYFTTYNPTSKTLQYYLRFKNLNDFYKSLIVFLIVFLFLSILNYFNIYINFIEFDSYNYNFFNDPNRNINQNVGSQNIHNHINIPTQAGNNFAAGATSAGATFAGYQVAKHVPGTPIVKGAAGLVAGGFMMGGSYLLSKGFNYNNNSNTKNFISNNLPSDIDYNKIYETFPLNLFSSPIINEHFPDLPLSFLSDLYIMNSLQICLVFIIINTYIAEYFLKINFSKYLPNNKIGKILNYFINNYINIWNKSKKFIKIYSFIMLICCTVMSKLAFYFLISNL